MVSVLDRLPIGAGVALAALLGVAIGSFVATLVLRWPVGRSVLAGRSSCDGCGRTLTAWELVPILSNIASRGKCRTCDLPIDPLHNRTEWAAGFIGAAALLAAPGAQGWVWALFGWLLLPLVLLDARHYWLPDRLTGLLAIVGLLIAGPLLGTGLLDRWVGALVGGAVLALIAWAYRRWRGVEGMGGGDPKLVAAIGAWIGWQALPLTLLLASGGGLLWALTTEEKGDPSPVQRQIPFGAFVAVAAWAAVPIWPLVFGRFA